MLAAAAAKREKEGVLQIVWCELYVMKDTHTQNGHTLGLTLTPLWYKLQAMIAAAAAKREKEGVLQTRAQREAEAAKRRRRYRKASIRVRFADGTMLQVFIL